MKAIVLMTRPHEAAVLAMDGSFRVQPGEYRVGQTINIDEKIRATWYQWVAAIVIAVILLGGSVGLWVNNNYVAYAEVEVGSIIYKLNRRNQVISVEAVDEVGTAIIDQVKGIRNLTEAVEKAVELTEATEIQVTSKDSSNQERIFDHLEAAVKEANPTLSIHRSEERLVLEMVSMDDPGEQTMYEGGPEKDPNGEHSPFNENEERPAAENDVSADQIPVDDMPVAQDEQSEPINGSKIGDENGFYAANGDANNGEMHYDDALSSDAFNDDAHNGDASIRNDGLSRNQTIDGNSSHSRDSGHSRGRNESSLDRNDSHVGGGPGGPR